MYNFDLVLFFAINIAARSWVPFSSDADIE